MTTNTEQNHPNCETPLLKAKRNHQLRMARDAYRQVLHDLTSRPPEAGCLLLGPIGSDDVTGSFFDASAGCSGATYTPDHVTLNRRLKEEWMPSGIDFKGFAHSHPGTFGQLSDGDLRYIARLLAKNGDMAVFAAPIVVPAEFRLCPFIVTRDEPDRAQQAELVLF